MSGAGAGAAAATAAAAAAAATAICCAARCPQLGRTRSSPAVAALSTTLSTAALDKHPQSKERGITLDLGFSSFTVCVDLPLCCCGLATNSVGARLLLLHPTTIPLLHGCYTRLLSN